MHMDTTPYALRSGRQRSAAQQSRGFHRHPPDSPARPLSSPPELVEQRHHLAGSCAAQRVSQGDGAAVRVDLVQRDSQRLHTVHSLGGGGKVRAQNSLSRKKHAGHLTGEGLVDFKDVHVLNAQSWTGSAFNQRLHLLLD